MTDATTGASTPGAPSRLYSQVPHDGRGNFHYQGDLFQSGEPLASLAARIERHLGAHFPDARFAISSQRFAGGRKIIADILDAPGDLTARDAQNAYLTDIRDQMERFGFTRSNLLQDFHSCAFYAEARIAPAYWAALATRQGLGGTVEPRISLAAFKKQLRPGDRMELISAPSWHRSLGATRIVTAVRSKDLVFDGRTYLSFPRASQFAFDGTLVRFAIGTEHEPSAHLLYRYHPQTTD